MTKGIKYMSADQLRELIEKRARSMVRQQEIMKNQEEVIDYFEKVQRNLIGK